MASAGALIGGAGDRPRRCGCGRVSSCCGVCPKLLICALSDARSVGSAIAERSIAPSYVTWKKTLSAPTAPAPRCLAPKT
eukprot:5845705-Prymnesium_polylepis.1